MTNSEIMMCLELLKKLGDVRGKFGWYIYRNIKILSEACEEAVKIRNEAVKKYGIQNENGTYSLDPACEGWADYVAEMEPVMQIEQDVKLKKISREEFEALAEDAGLSVSELAVIDEIIVEDKGNE